MADFQFKAELDASGIISGAQKGEQAINNLDGVLLKTFSDTDRMAVSASGSLVHMGDGAAASGQKIAEGIGGGLKKTQQEFDNTKKHSDGFFGGLKEKFSDIGGLLAGGTIFAGAGLGLEKLFSAGEKRIKSLEDYRIALRQSGVEENKLSQAQAEGGKIVSELAGKYARSGTEIRAVLTQVTGLGGISVEQSKKVAEIGLAFEQVGVPAKAFKAIIAGASGPESLAALEGIKTKFPGIASAMQGAGSAGEKIDAIFKGISPTLTGMKEAADGPLGSFDRIKQASGALTGALGETLIEGIQPFTGALLGAASFLKDPVIPAITSVSHFLLEHKAAVGIVAGAYIAFRSAIAIQEAGGLVKTLTNVGTKALEAGQAIVTKLIPGIFAKTAAETADATAKTAETAAEVGNTLATEANVVAKETATVAEEGMAVASEGLGAAMTIALGPIGLVIAAIAAGALLFLAFSNSTKDLGEATKEAGESLEEFNTKVGDSNATVTKANDLDSLATKYDQLSAKQNRTAAEQKELDSVTAQLSKSVPEAGDKYDSFTGKLSIASDRVHDLADEQRKLAEEEKKDALNDLTDKTEDLANSYKAAQDNLAKLQGQQALLKNNINIPTSFFDGLKQSVFLGDSAQEKQKEVLHQIVEQRKEMEKARPVLQANVKALEGQGFTAEQVAEKLGLSVDQVKKLEAAGKESNAQIVANLQTATKLAEQFNKAKEEAGKINTEAIAAGSQVQLTLNTLQNSLKEARAQGDADRIKSVQALIDEQTKLLDANVGQAKAQTFYLDALEKANAQVQDEIDKKKHVVELQDALNKKAEEVLEKDLRSANAHKLSSIAEAVLTAEKLRGLEATEGALRASTAYQYTQLQQRQLAEKIAGIELQKEQLLEKQAEQAKKILDEYLKIQEANINAESGLLSALGQFGGDNIDQQLQLFELRADGVRLKLGLLRDELGKHSDFGAYVNALGQIVDENSRLREGVDLSALSFDVVSKAIKENAERLAFNLDLTKQINAGLIKTGAVKPKELIPLDQIIAQFTELQKIGQDELKFFEDRLKRENELATLREDVGRHLFGFDPQQAANQLDRIQHTLDAELKIIDQSNLQGSAKDQARLQAQKKYYDDRGKVIDDGLKRIKDSQLLEIQADQSISAFQRQIEQVKVEATNELLVLQEKHNNGLVSEQDYQNQIILIQKNAQTKLKAAQQELGKDLKETLGAGFSAAFAVANKDFFEKIDKELNASDDAFGAFAAGALKHIIEMGEGFIATTLENIAATLLTAATVSAAMATIQAAAAPAAFAVAVASFGAAPIAAGTSLLANYLAFQTALKAIPLAEGTVIGQPTLALIGEEFQEEAVIPMKTAKEFLAEAADSIITTSGLTKADLKSAYVEALHENPIRGVVTGYDVHLVNQQHIQRMSRRGA